MGRHSAVPAIAPPPEAPRSVQRQPHRRLAVVTWIQERGSYCRAWLMSLEGERPPKPVPVRKPDWLVLLVALATMMVGVLGALALFLWWLGSGLS